jgi:4-amino-4-deoxy-L-arabinose transferase-like glycosyltransferase
MSRFRDRPRHPLFRKHRLAIAILLLALLVRLVVVAENANLPPRPIDDDGAYLQLATSLWRDHAYVSSSGQPTAYMPPGYPLILAVLFTLIGGPSILAAQALNVFFSMLILVSLYAIALKLFSPAVAVLGLALAAFYPPQIAYVPLLFSEIVTTGCLFAGVALLLYRRAGVAAGAFMALALLARPQYAPIVAVFIGWKLIAGQDRRRVIFAAAMVAIVLAGWTLRNFVRLGEPVFSTNTGVNLYMGNRPEATGRFDPTGLIAGENELSTNRLNMDAAKAYIFGHLSETVLRWPAKLAYLFGVDDVHMQTPAAWIINAAYHFIMILTALMLPVALIVRRRSVHWLPLALIVAGIMPPLIFFAEARFNFPLMPFIALYAAATVVLLAQARSVGMKSSVEIDANKEAPRQPLAPTA